MSFEQLLSSVFTVEIWHIAKVFVMVILLLYIIFSYVVFRQADLMAKTLAVPIYLPIKIIALVHLFLAIFAFVLAVAIL